ncbi:MAG: TonB-dependent receptor [Sphingomonadaceae bacterium]
MRATILLSASLAAVAALPAAAQAPAAAGASGDDIIVTATRREQGLQDVPLAITALSGGELANRGITDVTTLASSVPGLSFGKSGTDARPAIRGVRTEEVDAANDPVIGFFVDGVYKPRTSQALAAFIDLDRVEVLRGPQGTLFGRNTYGGSINLVSKLPQPEFGAEGSVRYASFNDLRLEGVLNLPLTPAIGLRLVGMWQQSDGWVKVEAPRVPTGGRAEDFNDNDQWYVRGTLKFDVSDSSEIIIRASHWDQGGFGAGGFGYTTVGTLRANPGAGPGQATGTQDLGGFLDRNNPRTGATPLPSDRNPYRVFRNTDKTRNTEETTANFEFRSSLSGIGIKLLASHADFRSYRVGDEDFSESFGSLLELDTRSKSSSAEFQLTSEYESPLQWVLGAYYFNESVVEDFFFRTPTNPNSFTFRQDVSTDSLAAYGQLDFKVADQLTLVAGGRYTWDNKRFIYQSPVGATDLAPDSAEFRKFTWRLGANFDVTPNNLIYASVSTGFRSGGFNNGGNPPVPFYGPQTVTAYEIGSKNQFPAAGLTLNLAAFYNDYNDILSNTFVQVGPTNVVARSNSGSARAYGVEAELVWKPIEDLTIDANATWLNARFETFQATRPLAQATGFRLVPGSTNQLDLSGNRIPLSPDFTFQVGASYRIGLGGAGSLTPEARFFWSDDYFVNEFNYDAGIPGRAVGRQGSYTQTSLRLTWMSGDERFMLQGFVDNLEDKAILNRAVIGGQGAIFQNYAPPRIFGVKGGFRF